MSANGYTYEFNGYQLTIEQVGKVWRGVANGATICSCTTRKATKDNAEFLLRSPFAARLTQKIVGAF